MSRLLETEETNSRRCLILRSSWYDGTPNEHEKHNKHNLAPPYWVRHHLHAVVNYKILFSQNI